MCSSTASNNNNNKRKKERKLATTTKSCALGLDRIESNCMRSPPPTHFIYILYQYEKSRHRIFYVRAHAFT